MNYSKLTTYKEMKNIAVHDNGEPFVKLSDYGIKSSHMPNMNETEKYLGYKDIIVRKSIAEALVCIDKDARSKYNKSLLITYGYRPLEVQIQYFLEEITRICSQGKFFSDSEELYEEAAKNINVPTVAGHPTGGAIDALLETDGVVCDFGTEIYDFSKGGYEMANRNISLIAYENRTQLRSLMLAQNFAPFNGEYRHFSKWDQEWAAYYEKPYAFYAQKKVNELLAR